MDNEVIIISALCIGGFNDTIIYDTIIKYQGKVEHLEIQRFWNSFKEKELWKINTSLKLNYETKKSIIEVLDKDRPSMYSDVKSKEYNINITTENKIKSLKDWYESDKENLTDYLHIEDKVDRSLIYYLVESLTPITLNGEIIQMGGAYSTDSKGRNTYLTFAKEVPFGDWYYKGACIMGETINRERSFEEIEIRNKINVIEYQEEESF